MGSQFTGTDGRAAGPAWLGDFPVERVGLGLLVRDPPRLGGVLGAVGESRAGDAYLGTHPQQHRKMLGASLPWASWGQQGSAPVGGWGSLCPRGRPSTKSVFCSMAGVADVRLAAAPCRQLRASGMASLAHPVGTGNPDVSGTRCSVHHCLLPPSKFNPGIFFF